MELKIIIKQIKMPILRQMQLKICVMHILILIDDLNKEGLIDKNKYPQKVKEIQKK